jgi:hypothetical protein
MSILGATCPHCHKENVAFQSIAEVNWTIESTMFTVFFKCASCYKGLTATIQMRAQPTPHKYDGDIQNSSSHPIIDTYPKPPTIEAPLYIPDNIRNFYLQTVKSFRHQSWDASAIMSRKVIEATAKHLDPKFSGNLKQRIDNLAAQHIITESMKDWAHEIRLEANVAAHEVEEFDEKSAKDLLNFSEPFLMYVFTLPGMLEERRKSDSD